MLATERERGESVSESEKRGNGGWRGQWRKEDEVCVGQMRERERRTL